MICPVCQSYNLIQSDANIILCSGGSCLRLDIVQDGLTLPNLRTQLDNVYKEHGLSCNGVLSFGMVNQFGITTLQAVCRNCRCNHTVV